MNARISSFKELQVYQFAFGVQQEVFELTKSFPKEERYALTDQFRRASRSIGANIAEAWQKRRYVAHFVSKLTDAGGEQAETQHWIASAATCGYLNHQQQQSLMDKCLQIGRMLGKMLSEPGQWCH